jgi:hypothetical protein
MQHLFPGLLLGNGGLLVCISLCPEAALVATDITGTVNVKVVVRASAPPPILWWLLLTHPSRSTVGLVPVCVNWHLKLGLDRPLARHQQLQQLLAESCSLQVVTHVGCSQP